MVNDIAANNSNHYFALELVSIKRCVFAFGDKVLAIDNPFLVGVKDGDISLAARLECAQFTMLGADDAGWLTGEF